MLRGVSGFTSVPTLSIGTNVNADNILPARALTGCDVTGEYIRIELGTSVTTGVWRGMSASDSVTLKAKVTVAAVATQYEIEVQVVGAYV